MIKDFKVGDLVFLKWSNIKPNMPTDIYLVTKIIPPDQGEIDKAALNHTKYPSLWTERHLKAAKQPHLELSRVFTKNWQPINSRTTHTYSAEYIEPAIDYLEKFNDDFNNYFNKVKEFIYEQELHILQGRHGNHRAGRSHLQNGKRVAAGTGAV